MKWSWQAPDSTDPQARLDSCIFHAMQLADGPKISRSQIRRFILDGRVSSTTSPLKPSSRVLPGMTFEVDFPQPKIAQAIAQDIPIDVLYQDSHFLVLNKAVGRSVHPSVTEPDGTLVNALLHHVSDLSGIGGELRPGIVHRLDKFTSGCLIVAKNDRTHQELSRLFSERKIKKTYLAYTYGSCKELDWKRLETEIGRDAKNRKRMSTSPKVGKQAISSYRTIRHFGNYASLVEVQLETGRTHQIRVHLTAEGHSILGDSMYGKPSANQKKWKDLPRLIKNSVSKLPGQALHARSIEFELFGKTHSIEAPLPEHLVELNALLSN